MQRPSTRRIFWWRAVLRALLVLMPLYIRDSPTPRPEPAGLELGALLVSVPLSLFFGAVTFVVATRPYFERSSQLAELVRKTRAARRETLRAVRRGEPVPAEREPLLRLWIDWYRAGTRSLGWTGLLFTWQLLLSASPPGWWTVALLTIAALWVGASVETLRRERAHRLWEPRQHSAGGAG